MLQMLVPFPAICNVSFFCVFLALAPTHPSTYQVSWQDSKRRLSAAAAAAIFTAVMAALTVQLRMRQQQGLNSSFG